MGLLVRVPAKYGTCISLRLESKLTFITIYALPKDKYILVEGSSTQAGKDASCCKKHAHISVILFSHRIFFHEKGREINQFKKSTVTQSS